LFDLLLLSTTELVLCY